MFLIKMNILLIIRTNNFEYELSLELNSIKFVDLWFLIKLKMFMVGDYQSKCH